MTHGSLFSCIGGFDLAAHQMGWENAFHCEIDPFGRRVLEYYWPKAFSYGNIRESDFTIWRGRIDVLTGGFPCQPFSLAGKRKGKEDDRYLWPEMLRAIDEVRPRWVCGENVAGIVSMVQPEAHRATVESTADFFGEEDSQVVTEYQQYVIETICNDLERIGYSVQPVIIPACAVGAPHRRDRVWFIANAEGERMQGEEGVLCETNGRSRSGLLSEPNESGDRHENKGATFDTEREPNGAYVHETSCGTWMEMERDEFRQAGRQEGSDYPYPSTGSDHVADATMLRCQGDICQGDGLLRNKCTFGKIGTSDRQERSFETARSWINFPSQPAFCGGDDGLPSKLDRITLSARNSRRTLTDERAFTEWRNQSLKGYGNAIVHQVALEIFKAIEQWSK